MRVFSKKTLSIFMMLVMICTMFAFLSTTVTVSAAKTNKYSDFIKYRGQDLKNTYAKLKKGDEVKVLYYGGSVTNGTGATNAEKYSWRALVGSWLTNNFPKANVNNINVSYGGTGSYFGAYRVKEEVISKKPDLIFIEFAINDHYDNQVRSLSKEKSSMQFETIVRTIRSELPNCDIVTVLTTEKGYVSTDRAGDLHTYAQAHEDISIAYNIPSLHIGRALSSNISYSDFDGDWNKYMTDIVHPTNAGYELYFNVIKEYLSNCLLDGGYDGKSKKHTLPRQVNDRLLDGNLQYIDVTEELVNESRDLGGKNFHYSSTTKLRGYPGGAEASNGANSKFVVEFTGTELALLQSSTNVESFQVTVDGKTTSYAANYNIYPEVLVTGLKSGNHTVAIQPVFKAGAGNGSFFIMGFFSRDENMASAKYDHAKHILKTYVSNKDATCKRNGTKTAKCTVKGCDYSETVEDKGSKLPHKYVIKTVRAATKTKDGEGDKICTLCGRFDGTVVIPKGKTAEDIILSENDKTQSELQENSAVESTGGNSATVQNGSKDAEGEEIPTELIIILAVVLVLLLAGIVTVVLLLIQGKKGKVKKVVEKTDES